MPHSVVLSSIISLETSGQAMAKLRYDSLIVILLALQAELRNQAAADEVLHRHQLSLQGKKAADDLGVVIKDIRAMLKLSDSHMSEEYKIVPRLIVN